MQVILTEEEYKALSGNTKTAEVQIGAVQEYQKAMKAWLDRLFKELDTILRNGHPLDDGYSMRTAAIWLEENPMPSLKLGESGV